MKAHNKHSNLPRRNNERYAPNEIAILGSNCTQISTLVHAIAASLPQYTVAYFDASHQKDISQNLLSEYTFHNNGNVQIHTLGSTNPYELRIQFSKYDLVFINGNHYQGAKQVLMLDEAKEASVLKRIDQLNDIQFIVKLKEETALFPSLKAKIPDINRLTSYAVTSIDNISAHIEKLITKKTPPVKGLVLVGGKSTRMGVDKAELVYFDKPQKEHVSLLLADQQITPYFSVNKPSENEYEITDTFLNLGPFGGICSAFQKDPNTAWLVMATDVPFVTEELIALLLSKRNPSKVATAIKGFNSEFMEPLITIYEPKAYPLLLQFLSQGYSCPRKMLINSEVEVIEVADYFIRNINTQDAYLAAKKEIAKNEL